MPELNEARRKMMYYFFSFPLMETGLNDLAEELKISKTTAKVAVELMVKQGFLIKKIYGKTWRITCNQHHYFTRSEKIAYNLSLVYEAYNKAIRNIIHNRVGNARSVVLFGSYRKGDDTEKSDIDIAVEVAGAENITLVDIGKIAKFGYRINVPVTLHVFCRTKIDINLFSNIANGIVLEGFLEARP